MPHATVGNVSIYYEEEGQGEPLVLIAGLACELSSMAAVRNALSDTYHVIAFDNRGAGRSSAPEDGYSIARFAKDTHALMQHLGVERAHVLGVSMGSMIAQELALLYPAAVGKLVLMASTARPSRHTRRLIRVWIDVVRATGTVDYFLRESILWGLPAEYTDSHPEGVALLDEFLKANKPTSHGLIGQCRAILGHDTEARVSQLRIPVLVVSGTEDLITPMAGAERLAQRLCHGQFRAFEGCGHIFPGDAMSQALQVIGEFLVDSKSKVRTMGVV